MLRFVKCVCLSLTLLCVSMLPACGTNSVKDAGLELETREVEINNGEELVWSMAQKGTESCVLMLGKAVDSDDFSIISTDLSGNTELSLTFGDPIHAITQTGDSTVHILCETETGLLSICSVSPGGEILRSAELSIQNDKLRRVVGLCHDSKGGLYICWSLNDNRTAVTALSSELEAVYTIQCSGEAFGFAMSGDVPCCLLSGNRLLPVETRTGEWGESIDPGVNVLSIFSSGDGELLLNDGNALLSFELDSGEVTRLFSWAEQYIDGFVLTAAKLENGEYAVVSQLDLFALGTMLDEEADEREVITVAAGGNWRALTDSITEYNRTNTEYRIELMHVEDETLFSTRLISGEVPDIFLFENFIASPNLTTLGKAGYLANLYEFIDSDSELSRDSFVSSVLMSCEHGDGVLWELPVSFCVNIMAADSSFVGEMDTWTCGEVLHRLEETGFEGSMFGAGYTQLNVLSMLLSMNIDSFVDWANAEACFDTQEFCDLLYLCKTYAPEIPETASDEPRKLVENGEMLFKFETLSTIGSLQKFDYYFNDPALVGFPTDSGSGNTVKIDYSFGISSLSEHKDAAWDFVRRFYLPEFYEKAREQSGYAVCFSVNAEVLEDRFNDPLEYFMENGVTSKYLGDNYEYQITVQKPTQRDIENMREIIYSVDKTSRADRNISAIVQEEAAVYFADGKSVEETAKLIQSRVQLYLSEQA